MIKYKYGGGDYESEVHIRQGRKRQKLLFIKYDKKRIENGVNYPLIMVVPEQFSFQAEKNLIDIIGTRGIFQAEVMSFRRMAFKVFSEVGGITRQHMNPSGKSMLLYKIMEENKNKLSVFKNQQEELDLLILYLRQ